MDEDKILKEKLGKKMPFRVPEGYFENLTDEIMSRLPEKEITEKTEVTLWDRVKPMLYMAAMFLGLIFGANLFINRIPNQRHPIQTVTAEENGEMPNSIIDPINHQLMMDDYTLYQYLTSADGNQPDF